MFQGIERAHHRFQRGFLLSQVFQNRSFFDQKNNAVGEALQEQLQSFEGVLRSVFAFLGLDGQHRGRFPMDVVRRQAQNPLQRFSGRLEAFDLVERVRAQ